MKRIVIALGGNALLQRGEKPTFAVQLRNAQKTAKHLARALKSYGSGFVITHGNGPQVGDEFLRNLYASKEIPKLPLSILNAETQALIGSIIELSLSRELKSTDISTVITHTLVDKNDKAFAKPTKPIGPFYTKAQLDEELRKESFKYIKANGAYRRVVPSPKPLRILEIGAIKELLKSGHGVICCGGGGVPIFRSGSNYVGAEAVIDKDRTTELLATQIKAERMVILTNVDYVYTDYKRKKGGLAEIEAGKLRKMLGSFEEGTMRPKLEACISFIEHGGKSAVIGSLFDADNVISGRGGTRVTR